MTASKETVRGHSAVPIQRMVQDPAKVIPIAKILPWKATKLDVKPFADLWCFNPSIHFDGKDWRCSVRCADYAMPDGVQIRSQTASTTYSLTRNAIIHLDPTTWKPIKAFELRELDAFPRIAPCAHIGFEDVRLFSTKATGLMAIAASLQLGGERAPKHPEQVLLSLDEHYNIVDARPIRGIWNSTPQKNWVPFEDALAPRFIYSIERGIVFDAYGPTSGWPEAEQPYEEHPKPISHGGTEVKLRRKTVVLQSGRTGGRLEYGGLRGGSQLTFIGADDGSDDRWLGIAHEMRFISGKKFYWHAFYVVNAKGEVLERSPAIKLASEGIEFAAGMAIDGDRVVISYGVDDMLCRIGVTSLSAVLAICKANTPIDTARGTIDPLVATPSTNANASGPTRLPPPPAGPERPTRPRALGQPFGSPVIARANDLNRRVDAVASDLVDQPLNDVQVDQATLKELRAAYRALRNNLTKGTTKS